MKLDFSARLSGINVSGEDQDKDSAAGVERKQENEGGSRETLLHLRKRSRKRRSFMETDYTSRVTYPEPDPEPKHNLASNRRLKNLLVESSDAQILSPDPEPSEQTQNPSPTVSSLAHSEGEPAQLESKPIPSKLRSHRPELKSSSRTRKQDMEMEPDAMESKSVTDLVKTVSPSITVVRCRVDPDGKESADRRGDGKEEGEEEEEMGEGKDEADKEEPVGMTGNGPFTSHMFLPDIIEEDCKEEEEKKERVKGFSSSLKRPLLGAERSQEDGPRSTCSIEVTEKRSEDLLCSDMISSQVDTYVNEYFPPTYSPPPPPPSSPLPPAPDEHKHGSLEQEEGSSENVEASNKMSVLNHTEQSPALSPGGGGHADEVLVKTIHSSQTTHVSESAVNTSDEVTDSTNSDNVFDDDDDDVDGSNSSICGPSDKTVNISDTSARAGTDESHIGVEVQTGSPSINPDYTLAINSITAKLGAATSITSPTFNSDTRLKSDAAPQSVSPSDPDSDNGTSDPPKPRNQAGEHPASPTIMMAKTATVHDLSKDPPTPTRFLFQTCSPTIMGRLSATTLRGKIQSLPLYLSRSQDGLNRAGDGSTLQSPAEGNSRDDSKIAIKVTDVHDVTKTLDLEMSVAAESAESDDSDTTLTGSEVDGEFFVETTSAKSLPSGSEVKEARCQQPVQTEPKPQHRSQPLHSRLNQSTPGPVTAPPPSIVSLLQRDTTSLKINPPGPIKDPPEPIMKISSPEEDSQGFKGSTQPRSIPLPMVVTTQNLNGPGLAFHSQSQRASKASSDRPLTGLCRPSEQNSDSAKPLSSGCRVFTICEGPSQTKTSAEAGSAPPLKSEFSCGSVLASGCESVAEGVQVPLDACGCPAVYTNCFSTEDSFDEELTVYEFSCRAQRSSVTQISAAGPPLITSPPAPSFLSASSTNSPSFPRSILFSSSTSELSPLLSPLSNTSDSYASQMHKDIISRLGQQRYPDPPAGFQALRMDVDKLLSVLEGSSADRSLAVNGGRHPRDSCPVHFTENKRVLQIEARRLMSGCQKVVGTGQSPEEMLQSLADSFRTLVELAGICLWFSGCDRCDRRNAEAVAGLADVARSFRDFCLAAERACSKRSCQDLSTKLLAKQCTALTASVFCLTQLFRTLTAL